MRIGPIVVRAPERVLVRDRELVREASDREPDRELDRSWADRGERCDERCRVETRSLSDWGW